MVLDHVMLSIGLHGWGSFDSAVQAYAHALFLTVKVSKLCNTTCKQEVIELKMFAVELKIEE